MDSEPCIPHRTVRRYFRAFEAWHFIAVTWSAGGARGHDIRLLDAAEAAVCVPADAGAHSRNLPKDTTMDEDELTLEAPITPAPVRRTAPRERQDLTFPKAAARRAFGASQLHGKDLDAFVDRTEGLSERQTRAAIFEKMVEVQERTATFPHVSMGSLHDDGNAFAAMSQAIRHKIQPSFKPTEARAQEFIGLSFVEIARRSVERAGGSTNGLYGGNVLDQALGRAYQTTSDFGPALGSAVREILLNEFEQMLSPIAQAFRTEVLPDFRDASFIQGLEGQDLLPVNEHGEFRRGMLVGEAKEVARLGTFGRITPFSRQLLISDQLGAIARFIDDPARKAAELEANLMILQLESSTILMSDGRPLFDLAHKNLSASGSALTEASLNAAILQVEKGHLHANGRTIFQRPKYLIVPSELRLVATKLLASVQATTTADVNPMTNILEVIVEPRLTSATAWYVAADPQRSWGGVFLRLAGQERPFIDYRTGFDVDGLEVKVRHDCGAGFADFRSWYKNPGV